MKAPGTLIQGDRLALVPEQASIRLAGDWLQQVCARYRVPAKPTARLDLCLHEALANVLAHGGKTALSGDIVVELRVCLHHTQGDAVLEVQDAGSAFNPLSSAPKSAPQSLAAGKPGGLGIVMIRSNADLLEYKREQGMNHLLIGVRWQASEV